MRIRGSARAALAAVAVLACAVTISGPGADAKPARDPIDFPSTDALVDACLQLAPHTISVTSTPVTLDVRVVLDGTTRADGVAAVAGMRRAYAPLGISVAPTYQVADLQGRISGDLIAQAKNLYGGRRPAGADVVYVLTDADIVSGSATGGQLAGQADCIGGIRNPRRAFAVGELGSVSASGVVDGTANNMAHEIGHLLGAHHHHTSPEGLLAGDVTTPLSLMGPTIDLISLRFSTVEALMVRGHAQKYAG